MATLWVRLRRHLSAMPRVTGSYPQEQLPRVQRSAGRSLASSATTQTQVDLGLAPLSRRTRITPSAHFIAIVRANNAGASEDYNDRRCLSPAGLLVSYV